MYILYLRPSVNINIMLYFLLVVILCYYVVAHIFKGALKIKRYFVTELSWNYSLKTWWTSLNDAYYVSDAHRATHKRTSYVSHTFVKTIIRTPCNLFDP